MGGCTALPGEARLDARPAHAGLAFEGLISRESGRNRVRYVFQTHGINSPTDDWANALLEAIPKYGYAKDTAAGFGWRAAPLAQPMKVTGRDLVCDPPHADCVFPTFGDYQKTVFVNSATGDRLVVFSYRWRADLWSITGHYVAPDIRANTVSGLSTRRSIINAGLKVNVIDDGFSDAVGYLSGLGALERQGMETAVCAMLADSIGQAPAPYGAGCLGRFSASDLSRLNGIEFNFLSHSLGSRMLYDLLSDYVPQGGAEHTRPETDARRKIRARTHELIMAANQMPLLAASEFHVTPVPTASTGPDSVSAFAPALAPARSPPSFADLSNPVEAGPKLHLTVVAFQDPDDLLGFKASDALVGSHDDSVAFVDVTHRNTSQLAFLFAWPPAAHDHELEEQHSLKMILCGANTDADGTLHARNCRGTMNGRQGERR